jgi:hypothetical protein
MTTYATNKLSASTDGDGITITASATPGTLVHTAVSGTTDYDEIWVWGIRSNFYQLDGQQDRAYSEDAVIEYGGSSVTIIPYIPVLPGSLFLLVPGLILNNAQELRMYNAGSVLGYIIEIRN